MIRINLIGGAAPKAQGSRPGPAAPAQAREPSESRGVLLAFLILGGAIGFIGYQYWNSRQTLADLDRKIQELKEEKNRLQAIIAQVNEFKEKVAQMERKERLIEDLERKRTGPVHMLDEISAQLPDFIWLTALNEAGGMVGIEGVAASYVSIADYIRKLEDTPYFQAVELVEAKQEQEYTRFSLRSEVVTPRAPGAAPTPGAPGGPGSN